ncbi:MAG: di-heme oxidoredictase family protein [Filomicrobium sp.]
MRKLNRAAASRSEIRFFALLCIGCFTACTFVALATASDREVALNKSSLLPGGAATTTRGLTTRNAFSQSSANIGFQGEARFKIGNAFFRKIWVSSPASTKSSDGLGPLYNARACQHCHLKDGRGHPPESNWPDDDTVSMFLRLSIPPQTEEQRRHLSERRIAVVPEPTYGGQLQDLAVQGHAGEGRMHITYEPLPVALKDGTVVELRKPSYKITNLGYGPLHPETMISPRVAPTMLGLGLLEAIPEQAIRAQADPDDENGDGISGRVSEVWSVAQKSVTLGRFGWKAGNPTVRQQSAGAFAGDMGLSTPMVRKPSGDCTARQQFCLGAPNGENKEKDTPEITAKMMDFLTFYALNLAVPARRNADAPEVRQGQKLFNDLGCAWCHTPTHVTGEFPESPNLSNQRIWPYTDLLLHDMGEGLADNRPEGVASGREWRTAPLWGIGLTKTVSGHTYFLHDGRARSIEEAILWHGGEAQAARDGYATLSKKERDALLAFVNSL